MIPSKLFLFYLTDTVTGKAYYKDQFGNIQLINIEAAGFPVNLENAPENWLGISLVFDRSLTYYGLNRVYSTPMEFVREVKDMILELTLQGFGVEQPLSLLIMRYNEDPQPSEPEYKLHIKAPLDLPESVGTVFESVTCNLMEGGVSQLLKNYENTVLSIPCDGSLPEHIKANYDGVYVPEKLYYEVVSIGGLNHDGSPATWMLPMVFINNEGDSYGAIKGQPTFQEINNGSDLFNNTNSWISFDKQTTVTIEGSVLVQQENNKPGLFFNIWYATSKNVTYMPLVPASSPLDFLGYLMLPNELVKFPIKFTVTLDPYEKLFMPFNFIGNNPTGDNTGRMVSGSFKMSFITKPRDSRPWGLTAYDLWVLIGKTICGLASTPGNVVSYDFTSELLQRYLNFFITSGDALRASNDPSYIRTFYLDDNGNTGFGPQIKITLKQFYESIRLPTFAAIGRGYDSTGKDTLFFEVMTSVFDSTIVNYSLGEVSKIGYELQSKDFRASDLYIGYPPQSYDQKAGKYEWNTTLKMKFPIKSFQQILSMISYIRWDVYGIQRLLAGVDQGASTSTTRNDSDNSFFGTVIDRVNFIYDYFRAYFISLVPNADDANNTNIHLATSQNFQKVDLPTIDGEQFQVNKDSAIFVFAKTGYSAVETTTLKMDAIVSSINHSPLTPDDTVTVKFWHNGVIRYQSTTTVTGVNTVIDPTGLGSVGGVVFPELYNYSDCIYMSVETSLTAVVQINTVSIDIGAYVNMSGLNIPIEGGTSQKLISMGTIIPPSTPYDGSSVVQYGYQYFQYNSLAYSNNFNADLGLVGYVRGQVANFRFNIYINGVKQVEEVLIIGTVSRSFFVSTLSAVINRSYQLNDIVFITATNEGSALQLSLQTATLTFTNTYVKAYNLYRVQYENLKGLPLLVTDSAGNFRTDQAGCPYNIEYVTPARLRDMWMPFFNSLFVDKVTDLAKFQTLDKNQFLSTTYNGITITEQANKQLLIDGRLFYPVVLSFEFKCPLTFAEMQSKLANGHVEIFISGVQFFVHILHIEQLAALNDTTKATGLLSSLTDLSIFAQLTGFNIDI